MKRRLFSHCLPAGLIVLPVLNATAKQPEAAGDITTLLHAFQADRLQGAFQVFL